MRNFGIFVKYIVNLKMFLNFFLKGNADGE